MYVESYPDEHQRPQKVRPDIARFVVPLENTHQGLVSCVIADSVSILNEMVSDHPLLRDVGLRPNEMMTIGRTLLRILRNWLDIQTFRGLACRFLFFLSHWTKRDVKFTNFKLYE